MEARRQSEAEIRDRVEGEARAKMLEIEEALRRQMKDTDDAREELHREYERVNIAAEKAARERLVDERKAEEERSQKHAEAMAAAEENVRLRFEAELQAVESLRQVEAEARERADMLKFEAAVKAGKDHREDEAEARTQVKEVQKKYDAELKASKLEAAKARWPGKSRSIALVSELGNGQGSREKKTETGENGQRRQPGRAAAPTGHLEQPAQGTNNSTFSATPGRRGVLAETETDMALLQGQDEFLFIDEEFNLGARGPGRQALDNLLARAARISEQQRRAVATQAEKEARDKVEAEAWLKLDDTVMAANEERAREHVEDKVVSDSLRQEVSDRNTGVEHDQRLEDWQTRRWRWICPSCGSEDQDRRKGPVCNNCSYLVGDGDGFEASVPEQGQPREDEIVTEEQFQKQRQGSPEHRATFTSLERAPQAEHQYSSKHAGQSVPDSIANNYRNAPDSAAKYIPRELSFLEPSFSVDTHTASLKKKLNPIRLNTAANHPLSGLDSNDPPVLPPIQLGNAKGINTTIPSLSEDTDLVEGFPDHDMDWSLITDLAEQRRRANRMAQRAYRKSL
ncbi:hypothetical protein NW754_010449 [Fusarium falciforme]|nr:hypothetical protein NW754_010449 [Fusarium falciforme]